MRRDLLKITPHQLGKLHSELCKRDQLQLDASVGVQDRGILYDDQRSFARASPRFEQEMGRRHAQWFRDAEEVRELPRQRADHEEGVRPERQPRGAVVLEHHGAAAKQGVEIEWMGRARACALGGSIPHEPTRVITIAQPPARVMLAPALALVRARVMGCGGKR